MSMQDPISDMFTCIRNGQIAKKIKVITLYSLFKVCILRVFLSEGFIKNYIISNFTNKKKCILIYLKYFTGIPVITTLTRISKPSLRIYRKSTDIPYILSGLGVVILSTSHGVMSDKQARFLKLGGEILCYIY